MDEIDERIDRFGYRNRGRDCLDDYQDEYLNVEDLLDDSSDCRQKNYENFTECFEETEFNSENSERENVFNSKDIMLQKLDFFVQSVYVSYRKDNRVQKNLVRISRPRLRERRTLILLP
ncbi:hypothetical protein B9Z55_012032 [Caenorhabditis nigoni]|uniref:Uncharacterized protein n=1 Tax=Caenorhabditis nigoni TaxID=1611254 RepID=A0A2G5TW02_9PELO|nr:hypothetical protein B9Z55_012032 [Caenorhabditis nigoni]